MGKGRFRVPARLNVRGVGILTALLINGFAVLALWQSYHGIAARAEQRTQALAQIYADFTYRALDTYDQILMDMRGFVADRAAPDFLRTYLLRQKAQHTHLLNLFVFDADGAIRVGTQDRAADLSDRDYVAVHRAGPDVGRYIGQPAVSRIVPGRRFFPLSRRLESGGAVAATVDLKDLAEAFDSVRDGADGNDVAIALVHQDGTLLVRSPVAVDSQDVKFTLEPLDGVPMRTAWAVSPFDGRQRIVTQRRVTQYPLMVLASIPTAEIWRDWARTAVPTALGTLVLTGGLFVLFVLLHRQAVGRDLLLADLAEAKDRAEQAYADLGQAQDVIVRSEKLAALGGLVAGVAHEINTPVGNAVTAASYLAKEVEELEAAFKAQTLTASFLQSFLATAGESARLTLSNCERAAELIHGFKQVAVDQTSGERRRFNLAEYVAEVLLSLKPKFKRTPHRVDIYIPDDIEVDSYPGALSQVLTNLMVNSLMHGFDDGRAGVIDLAARVDGDMLEIIYSDNGRGIPTAMHSQVFEPFFTTRRGTGGSGLGLNIIHNIVHRTLGGSLSLDSQEGRGVHFTIRFPLRAANAAAGAEDTPP